MDGYRRKQERALKDNKGYPDKIKSQDKREKRVSESLNKQTSTIEEAKSQANIQPDPQSP